MIRNHRLERVKYLLGVTHTFQSNKTPRVEIRGGFHVFFFYTIWTLAIEEVCPTSKEGNLLTEGLVLQVQEAIMRFLSHCSGPLSRRSFHFSTHGKIGVSIHF